MPPIHYPPSSLRRLTISNLACLQRRLLQTRQLAHHSTQRQPPQEFRISHLHGRSHPRSSLPTHLLLSSSSSSSSPIATTAATAFPYSCHFPNCRRVSQPARLYSSKQTSESVHKASTTPTNHENDPDPDPDPDIMPSVADSSSEDAYAKAFNNNSLWRRSLAETEPELFESLGKGQSPQILWIGCADSRCPETTILGLKPGEIFCHRNIANILVNTDINSLSVIQYAVQYLKVKHIIICGHTSCGGIAAALGNKKLGLIDTWLMPLRAIRQENLSLLNSLGETERGLKMVELNVRSGVKVLLENPIVIDAMGERGLQVHGLIYNVGTGELRELDIGEDEDVVKSRVTAFKTVD